LRLATIYERRPTTPADAAAAISDVSDVTLYYFDEVCRLNYPSIYCQLTASSRLLAAPNDSPKCLRFGLWLTLCTLNILLVRERSALATLIFTLRVCLSVILSVILSFCLSATSELNISETRPDSGMVTMDDLYKLAYGLSIGHTPDDVT